MLIFIVIASDDIRLSNIKLHISLEQNHLRKNSSKLAILNRNNRNTIFRALNSGIHSVMKYYSAVLFLSLHPKDVSIPLFISGIFHSPWLVKSMRSTCFGQWTPTHYLSCSSTISSSGGFQISLLRLDCFRTLSSPSTVVCSTEIRFSFFSQHKIERGVHSFVLWII